MARVTDRNNWFDIWFTDKQGMIDCMIRNMAADLEAGYDYFGNSIRSQREAIETYKAEFDRQVDEFKMMDEKQVNRWCFYDMKKRGVIA